MKRFLLACLILLMAQAAFAQAATPEGTPEAVAANAQTPEEICANAVPAQDPATRSFTAPEQVLQPSVDYRAIFCTGVGPVYVDLLEKYAPQAVNSFVFLAQKGFYNNTTFHRVIQDFMAQGGDPTATGTGGPGYSFDDEFVGFLNFDQPGWLAMANAGPNTNGSQFFITTAAYPSLDYQYTIFGQVLEGQENVGKIQLRDPNTATTPGTALNTVVIVTDPTTVKTTYVPPAPATQDDISRLIASVTSQLPPQLALDKTNTGIYTTEQTSQFAPDALRSDYAAFLNKYHHQFRAGMTLTNVQCDTQSVPYIAIGYTLDRFDTPDDAAAALNDGFLDKIEQVSGFKSTPVDGLDYPVYTRAQSVCNTDATEAITFWQRGHFVATAEVVFPASSTIAPNRWLVELVGTSVFERIFSPVLRPEMH